MFHTLKTRGFYKYIIILFILSTIITAYYFSNDYSEFFFNETRKVITTVLATFGSLGGIFLYVNSKKDRSKKYFSILLMMLATAAGLTLLCSYMGISLSKNQAISPFVVLYGGTYGFLMTIYPIEVFRPKWLNYKKCIVLFLPTILLVVALVIFNYYYGEIIKFESLEESVNEIFTLKFLLRIGICMYPLILLYFINNLKKEYVKWTEENYVVTENIDINWLNNYFIGYMIIIISYIYRINFYNPKSAVVHGSLFVFFSFFFYNRIFMHDSPYPNGYLNEIKDVEIDIDRINTEDVPISHYKHILQDWFNVEKPYLRKDFRLMDLNEKIPLNRTYLSKFINEEFNTNFNNFIADYRLQDGCDMLSKSPELPIKYISDYCGFSSPSVFTRTFINKYAITPSEYRNSIKKQGLYNNKSL